MFFYPAVLKRHSGCFSTIWLVATKGIKVPRRDFLKVNVISTCDDIMDYLLERVPPPCPDLPRPRFSLYLSSQLQYGVIVVFHRQCSILLDEIQFIVTQLLRQKSSQKINMEGSRKSLLLPDVVAMMEEAEGAPDPLFGVMQMQDVMPSPRTLMEMNWEYLREASPEHPEHPSPVAPEVESDITASQESITMREPETVTLPDPQFEGAELDHHPDILDILMAQTDDFPEEGLETPRADVTPGEPERELERRGEQEKQTMKEPTTSSIELQPTTVSSEDGTLLPQEEPGPHIDWVTPITAPGVHSSPQAAEEGDRRISSVEQPAAMGDLPEPVTRRKRRRRQLIFFDPETQLSEVEQQEQINNPLIETRAPHYPPPSPLMSSSAAELFGNPCTFLPEEIQFLWRQAANITPLSGSDLQVGERGIESTDSSDRERERELAEREEERLDPEEVLRLAAEAEMFEISAQGSLPLEGSDQREVSREVSPMYTSEREGSTVSRSALQDIPEAVGELPEQISPEFPGLLPELPEHEAVVFQSLLPPDVDRRTVSNIFQRLLENLSSRKVCAVQDEPFGDILISAGPNYPEVLLSP